MSIPACPVHKQPMKLGRDGKTYFCPRKDANTGEWCKEKASVEPGAPPATAGARAPAQASTNPKLLLLLGALDFAAKVYQGTGQAEDATNLANEIYRLNGMEDFS